MKKLLLSNQAQLGVVVKDAIVTGFFKFLMPLSKMRKGDRFK